MNFKKWFGRRSRQRADDVPRKPFEGTRKDLVLMELLDLAEPSRDQVGSDLLHSKRLKDTDFEQQHEPLGELLGGALSSLSKGKLPLIHLAVDSSVEPWPPLFTRTGIRAWCGTVFQEQPFLPAILHGPSLRWFLMSLLTVEENEQPDYRDLVEASLMGNAVALQLQRDLTEACRNKEEENRLRRACDAAGLYGIQEIETAKELAVSIASGALLLSMMHKKTHGRPLQEDVEAAVVQGSWFRAAFALRADLGPFRFGPPLPR